MVVCLLSFHLTPCIMLSSTKETWKTHILFQKLLQLVFWIPIWSCHADAIMGEFVSQSKVSHLPSPLQLAGLASKKTLGISSEAVKIHAMHTRFLGEEHLKQRHYCSWGPACTQATGFQSLAWWSSNDGNNEHTVPALWFSNLGYIMYSGSSEFFRIISGLELPGDSALLCLEAIPRLEQESLLRFSNAPNLLN